MRRVLILAIVASGAPAAGLTACRGDSGASSPPTAVTSAERIDEALAARKIDAEQALLQKVYAAAGDDRLAPQFRGDDELPASLELGILREAAGRFESLSPAARAALAPFFQPPIYRGSAWTPKPAADHALLTLVTPLYAQDLPGAVPAQPRLQQEEGWKYWDAPRIPVRVWWNPRYSSTEAESGPMRSFNRALGLGEAEEDRTASEVIQVLERTVWPKVVDLMGRAPKSDAGGALSLAQDGHAEVWGDGGNGRFDIYVVPTSASGAAVLPYPAGCSARPAFMLLDPRLPQQELGPRLAHELAHAIQLSYPRTVECDAPWDDAVATWASWKVYPRRDGGPTVMLTHPDATGLDNRWGEALWPFVLFMERDIGVAQVRAVYEQQYARHRDAVAAVDAALPGGLREQWPKFTAHAWNRDPTGSSFVTWAGQPETPREPADGDGTLLGTIRGMTIPRTAPMTPEALELVSDDEPTDRELQTPGRLRRRYYWFTVDDPVRMITVKNPHAGGLDGKVSIQALYHVRGMKKGEWAWKLADWSDRSEATLCRDVPAQDVDSLVIMISHAGMAGGGTDGGGDEPQLITRGACPTAFEIVSSHRVRDERNAVLSQVTFRARLEVDPASPEGELRGKGSYEGYNILGDAQCRSRERVTVRGALDGRGNVAALDDSTTMVTYSLTVPEADASHIATLKEEAQAERIAQIRQDADYVTFTGNRGTRHRKRPGMYMNCTGQQTITLETTVTRIGPPPR